MILSHSSRQSSWNGVLTSTMLPWRSSARSAFAKPWNWVSLLICAADGRRCSIIQSLILSSFIPHAILLCYLAILLYCLLSLSYWWQACAICIVLHLLLILCLTLLCLSIRIETSTLNERRIRDTKLLPENSRLSSSKIIYRQKILPM